MTGARFLVVAAGLLLAAMAICPAAAARRPTRGSSSAKAPAQAKAPTKAPIANPPMFVLFT